MTSSRMSAAAAAAAAGEGGWHIEVDAGVAGRRTSLYSSQFRYLDPTLNQPRGGTSLNGKEAAWYACRCPAEWHEETQEEERDTGTPAHQPMYQKTASAEPRSQTTWGRTHMWTCHVRASQRETRVRACARESQSCIRKQCPERGVLSAPR